MNKPISFRLRGELDADLISAIEKLDRKNLNNLCRDGLRLMLGIQTTKTTVVIEKPLTPPEHIEKANSAVVTGKPAVYIPKRRGLS